MRKLKKATETATETTAAPNHTPTTGPLSFTANAKDLAGALKRVAGFTDRRSTMPMLAHVLITGTATETTIAATTLPHSAIHVAPAWFVHATGQVCVSAKQLGDALKRIPAGDVNLRASASTPNTIELIAGSLTITIPSLHPRDFPKLPAFRPQDACLALSKVSAPELAGMIDAVKAAICRDETRFHLNGILFEAGPDGARMVATDGHRLAKVERPALGAFKLDAGIILPREAVAEVRKLLGRGDAEIGMLDKHLLIRSAGTTVAIRPIDATFPPYRQVIPTENRRLVTVDRVTFKGALDRAALVATKTRGVKLECVPDGLKLTCDHPDLGTASETIPADLNPAEGFAIGAFPGYLLDALAAIDDERITLAFDHVAPHKTKSGIMTTPELSPMLIRGTADHVSRPVTDAALVVVVMPMRI